MWNLSRLAWRWKTWMVLLAFGGLPGTGCHVPKAALPTPLPDRAPQLDPLLVKTLAILITGNPPSPGPIPALGAAHDNPAQQLEHYVDALLADARFSQDVVPRILFKEALNRRPWSIGQAYVLSHFDRGGATIYHFRQPCSAEAAVKVHPWWNLDTEVLVCPDSYRPTQFVMAGTRRCDTRHEADVPTCGCGPNLMRCFKDRGQQNEFGQSVRNEITDTVAWVVEKDWPIKTLFTATQTVRDRNAEYLYQRWRVEDGELAGVTDYRTWPAAGVWAPRHESAPGEHAGLLTTPLVLYMETDTRQRQKNIYDLLWCKEPVSGGASTQAMLALGSSNFQVKGELWRKLAAQPVCTSCHARLDYGMQFFLGYPDARVAAHFDKAAQSAQKGPLFGDDVSDLRGEAALTPAGFADLAIEQKEFAACMVRNVDEYVFGYKSTPDTRHALAATFARSGQFRALMRVALLRYAAQWPRADAPAAYSPRVPPTPVERPAALSPASELISISPQLRGLLDRHCVICHDEGDRDFRANQLPRQLAQKMLVQVSFGGMPKGSGGMAWADRQELAGELLGQLFSDPAALAQASSYFLTWRRATAVHSIDAAVNVVHATAGATPPGGSWRFGESLARPHVAQYTPGFATITAIEALRSCKAAGHKGDDLDRCLTRATAPENFIH